MKAITWCRCPDDHKGPHLDSCPEKSVENDYRRQAIENGEAYALCKKECETIHHELRELQLCASDMAEVLRDWINKDPRMAPVEAEEALANYESHT